MPDRRRLLAAAAALLVAAPLAASASDARTVTVRFPAGSTGTTVTDRIKGDQYVLYRLGAREGQILTVSLRPDNQSADFNVYAPGKGPGDEAVFSSATGGREYRGRLGASGEHTVSVFLNRAAARRGETATFDIVFGIE